VLVFLSFAAEDSEVAERIARWFNRRDVRICSRRGTRSDDPTVTGDFESKIGQADSFITVMSPDYLASASCRRERVVARHREPPDVAGRRPFIHVLEVRESHFHDAGELTARPWSDMTGGHNTDDALGPVLAELTAPDDAPSLPESGAGREPPRFRNRKEELDLVIDGLTSQSGDHFWMVIAPPQLGKSWFLDRININLEERPADPPWTVKLVELREKPEQVRKNAGAILGMLLGINDPVATDSNNLKHLAGRLIGARRPHLCLLDSAELLDAQTARTLRRCLSQIRSNVEGAQTKNIRFALVVASRGVGWGGVIPKPQLRKLRLTEFKPEIIAQALREMSGRMGSRFGDAELRQHAEHVDRLSEGLPALLYSYLNWIHDQNWAGMDRLAEEHQFDQLTQPYINRELLSAGSLFGPGAAPTEEQRSCVEEALRILVAYRFFTKAHLSQHTGPDRTLQPFLDTVGWTLEKLIDEIGGTDLLDRPQSHPWDSIYAPIRRLLSRSWYPSDASLAHAHFSAGQFMQSWGSAQQGSDQAVALVECLWHQSQLLSLNGAPNPGQDLLDFARRMAGALTESTGWSVAELRKYAVNRMDEDEELAEAAERIGLPIDELIEAVGGNQR
jgi:hypothetical protein